MKDKSRILLFLGLIIFSNNLAKTQSLNDRWDIEVEKDGRKAPAWLEMSHSGYKQTVGRILYLVGSSRPISKINVEGNKFSFSVPPQWDKEDNDLSMTGELKGDIIEGTVTEPNGGTFKFKGYRAPKLLKTVEPKWGKTITLFNGKNLEGWKPDGLNNEWKAEKGILKNTKSGANLVTEKTFGDFKLHIEFKIPKNGNSGVYLRGRHEVQVADSKEPSESGLGAIYGFVRPLELPSVVADVWHTYDITLVGRVVTVVLDGKTIIYKSEIPGITGGALDSKEGEPGPIYLQGDHTSVEYRNIKITLPKE